MILRPLILLSLLGALTGARPAPTESDVAAALYGRNVVKMQALAKRGADLSFRNEYGESPLFIAASLGDVTMVRFLLSQKPDLDARSLVGETALHVALTSGDDRSVQLLLAAGASPRVYTKACLSPFDYAAGFERKGAFEALKAATAKAPLPVDGTVDECGLKPEIPSFATAQASFFKRILVLQAREDLALHDYSVKFLRDHPRVGERFLAELVAALDQPSLPGRPADYLFDGLIRDRAAAALAALARTKPLKDRVAKDLLRVIERGPCSVFEATACQETTCNETGSKLVDLAQKLLKKPPTWPRSEEEETCYNCAYCADSRVGHAYDAALKWFATNPAYRPQAEAVMARQVKAKLLKSTEMKQKKRFWAAPKGR